MKTFKTENCCLKKKRMYILSLLTPVFTISNLARYAVKVNLPHLLNSNANTVNGVTQIIREVYKLW